MRIAKSCLLFKSLSTHDTELLSWQYLGGVYVFSYILRTTVCATYVSTLLTSMYILTFFVNTTNTIIYTYPHIGVTSCNHRNDLGCLYHRSKSRKDDDMQPLEVFWRKLMVGRQGLEPWTP